MGFITGIIKIIIIFLLVMATIFSIYLFGKDIIYIKEIVNETESNNGTCDFDWRTLILNCSYKENYCYVNGIEELNCKNEENR